MACRTRAAASSYIATKTATADKVLNSVDPGQAGSRRISAATRRMADAIVADPVKAVASGAVLNFVKRSRGRTSHRPAPDRHHAGAGLP